VRPAVASSTLAGW
jgi:hypothetical protein